MKQAQVAAIAGLALGMAVPAAALYIRLTKPSVAFAASYPREAQSRVMAALQRPDCTFVQGHGLNSFTSLSYRGKTEALNGMAKALAACPGVSLSARLVAKDEGWDWRLGHQAHGNSFGMEINTRSERIDRTKLQLPVRVEE